MIHNDAERIKAALREIQGVKCVTRGWPKNFEKLPTIAISKASDRPADFRDDREHVAELEYYIRIFTNRASEADRIAEEVDTIMEGLRYVRTYSYDDDDGDVRMDALRYRTIV